MGALILYIVIFATVLGLCACGCPNGWVTFERSCYLFSHEAKTFTEAEHYCNQHQAHLARIDDRVEDQFINAYLTDLKDASRWIGLTDADIEGFWKWSDGSSAEYINWYPGQPNQHKTSNCLALYVSYNYGWTDEPCSSTYMPICEKAESDCQAEVIG